MIVPRKPEVTLYITFTNQEKVKGDTLLIAACRYQMDVLVNFLLGFKKYIVHHINLVNFDGQTALHFIHGRIPLFVECFKFGQQWRRNRDR